MGSTLILTWIPNSTLKKNPRSIENSPAQTRVTPRRSPRQEYAHIDNSTSATQSPIDSAVDIDVNGSCDQQQSLTPVEDNVNESEVSTLASQNVSESKNNDKPSCTPTNTSRARVGVNVNPIRDKCTNLLPLSNNVEHSAGENGDSVSDATHHSVAVGAARQLALLRSRSDSSNKSVASVEMEGENLVIVTEETITDDAFVDPVENCAGEPAESLLTERYKETLDKLTAAASKSGGDDMQRLRQSLDLQLNLSPGNDMVEKVADFDFEIAALNTKVEGQRRSSSSTSGPDSTPPSPSEIPDVSNLSSPEADNDTFANVQQHDSDFVKHCMSFPENSVDFTVDKPMTDSDTTFRTAVEQVCGVFSVDLGTDLFIVIFHSVFFIQYI